jgi:hypothetical protein
MDGGFNPTLAWSPDGRWLASSNWDGSISIWDGAGPERSFTTRRAEADQRTFAWQLTEVKSSLDEGRLAAAEFHFTRLRNRTPPDMFSRCQRAAFALRFDDVECASSDLTAWLASGEPGGAPAWVDAARTLCLRNDRAGYLHLCARLLESRLADENPSVSWHVAEVLALAPGSCPDPGLIVSLATRAAAGQDPRSGVLIARGLAHYRAGHWAEAAADLQQTLRDAPHLDWVCWPGLALVNHRIGKADESQRWLKLAKDRLEQRRKNRDRGPADRLFEPLWPEFQILLAEATEQITPSGKKESPSASSPRSGASKH